MAVTNYYSVNGQIIGEATNGVRTDYLMDALGSVTGTVNSACQVVNTYRYKPYGALLSKTGVGDDPAFGWVGTQGYKQTNKKFSDFYVRARHYDSSSARWTTVDPIGLESGDENFYRYVASQPTFGSDPSGYVSLKGRATCDLPAKGMCTGYWCGQTYATNYDQIACNHDPCTKACPVWPIEMTGAFPNLKISVDIKLCKTCPSGKKAKSTCKVSEYRHGRTDLNASVTCGQKVKVKKGKCSIEIRIIDNGPLASTKNLIDLHPMAAEALWLCLHPNHTKPFTCGSFGEAGVTVDI